jgi:hypothetical protein
MESMLFWGFTTTASLLFAGITFWLQKQDVRISEVEDKISEFESKTIDTLARLETKMDFLIEIHKSEGK